MRACDETTMGRLDAAQTHSYSLLRDGADVFFIYQLKAGEKTRNCRFEPLKQLKARGLSVDRANYSLVYIAPLKADETLEGIFETFNVRYPANYRRHSLSVSDIIVLNRNGAVTAHYVDDIGFVAIPEFLEA
jgi:hypothetical protein